MSQLAFRQLPKVWVDDRETRRPGPTYTTVRELQTEEPQVQWFLIVGADQARRIETWHDWQSLLCLVHLVVADRDPELGQWHNKALERSLALPFNPIPISSTQIRNDLVHGREVSGLDPEVKNYIRTHQLYTHHSDE
jgi:nicotinate-nucleotide adenylyltransferase